MLFNGDDGRTDGRGKEINRNHHRWDTILYIVNESEERQGPRRQRREQRSFLLQLLLLLPLRRRRSFGHCRGHHRFRGRRGGIRSVVMDPTDRHESVQSIVRLVAVVIVVVTPAVHHHRNHCHRFRHRHRHRYRFRHRHRHPQLLSFIPRAVVDP